MGTREDNVYQAKLAEQEERYDQMVVYMKEVVGETTEGLTLEERNLLSDAYKKAVGPRLASWRVEGELEEEIRLFCDGILQLLENNLIPSCTMGTEDMVFYKAMQGDYLRYIAEITTGDGKTTAAENAKQVYKQATEEATHLAPTHPIRLGLALNYSVFMHEVLAKQQEACALAKGAFDDAIAELDGLEEADFKDSTLIMQILRDNLTLWEGGEVAQAGEAQ